MHWLDLPPCLPLVALRCGARAPTCAPPAGPQVLQFSQNRVNDSCKPLHLSVGGQLQGRERALAPKGL